MITLVTIKLLESLVVRKSDITDHIMCTVKKGSSNWSPWYTGLKKRFSRHFCSIILSICITFSYSVISLDQLLILASNRTNNIRISHTFSAWLTVLNYQKIKLLCHNTNNIEMESWQVTVTLFQQTKW